MFVPSQWTITNDSEFFLYWLQKKINKNKTWNRTKKTFVQFEKSSLLSKKYVWASELRTYRTLYNPLEMHKRLSANYVHSAHQPLFVYKWKLFETHRCLHEIKALNSSSGDDAADDDDGDDESQKYVYEREKFTKWNVFVALVHLICFRFGQIERMSERASVCGGISFVYTLNVKAKWNCICAKIRIEWHWFDRISIDSVEFYTTARWHDTLWWHNNNGNKRRMIKYDW